MQQSSVLAFATSSASLRRGAADYVGIGWFVLFLLRRSPVGATDEAGHVAGIEIIQPRRSAMNSLACQKQRFRSDRLVISLADFILVSTCRYQ